MENKIIDNIQNKLSMYIRVFLISQTDRRKKSGLNMKLQVIKLLSKKIFCIQVNVVCRFTNENW